MNLSPFANSALVLLLQLLPVSTRAADEKIFPAPLIFEPSGRWDGDGGRWSTFAIQIGTPPQTVRLLPSITTASIFPVWNLACPDATDASLSTANCSTLRGDVFNDKDSSTYQYQKMVQLPIIYEASLYPNGENATYGFDKVTLGYPAWKYNYSLPNTTIFPYEGDDFWIGTFGINPEVNPDVDDYREALPSLMGGLHDGNFTPSLSWGYHAGAYYRNFTNSGLASLILGGYDASRINISSNLTLSPNDRFGPFYLDVESITIGGQNFLPQALTKVSLDSQVTSLWLPTDVCQKFEDAYGLTWNATSEMYFVNDSQHSALQQQNPNVTFTLSNGEPDSTVLLDITLPYAAFDLELMPPTADDVTTYYFPLKQATNADQYTLGRTIMQEIYMIANFENGTMSLFNVMYPTNASSADIVTICPNDSPNCALGHASSSTLSAGAIAGIVVGAVVVLLLIIGAVWYKWFRKPKYLPAPSNRDSGGTFGGADKAELDASTSMGSPRNELDGFYAPKPELDSGYGSPPTGTGSGSGSNPRDSRSVAGQQGGGGAEEAHEAGGAEVQEMSATLRRSDLPGNTNSGRYELYGSTPPAEGREG